jgi:hypothetical protein
LLPTIELVERATSQFGRCAGSLSNRLACAWRVLPHERRLAAYASLGLFVTLFLPWYQETVIVPGAGGKGPAAASTSVTGWAAFSFVEAAVLLVAVGVLTLLFHRAEGRAFHLPGGDGWVITAAGAWACLLVVWRIFDKQSTSIHGAGASISGIEWGIFVALVVAGFLVYGGSRIRAAHRPEPPLPGELGAPVARPAPAPAPPAPPPPAPAPALPGPASAPRPAPVPPGRPPGWLSARPKHLGPEDDAAATLPISARRGQDRDEPRRQQ